MYKPASTLDVHKFRFNFFDAAEQLTDIVFIDSSKVVKPVVANNTRTVPGGYNISHPLGVAPPELLNGSPGIKA